jgi:DNA-binding NarL/FixJ family response regulator
MTEHGSATVVIGRLDPIVLRGVVAALEDHRFQVLASDLPSAELERAVLRFLPGVVILGELYDQPVLASLRKSHAAPSVLVLAHNPSRSYRGLLEAAGARCLALSASIQHLMLEIGTAVRDRETFLAGDEQSLSRKLEQLTERETAVFRCLGEGMSNAGIALSVGSSETTVKTHVAKLRRKLSLASRKEVAALAAVAQWSHAKD